VAKNSGDKKKSENRKNPWQKFVESMAKNLFARNVKRIMKLIK